MILALLFSVLSGNIRIVDTFVGLGKRIIMIQIWPMMN